MLQWAIPAAAEVSVMRRKGVRGLRWGELSLEGVTKQTKCHSRAQGPFLQSKGSCPALINCQE